MLVPVVSAGAFVDSRSCPLCPCDSPISLSLSLFPPPPPPPFLPFSLSCLSHCVCVAGVGWWRETVSGWVTVVLCPLCVHTPLVQLEPADTQSPKSLTHRPMLLFAYQWHTYLCLPHRTVMQLSNCTRKGP